MTARVHDLRLRVNSRRGANPAAARAAAPGAAIDDHNGLSSREEFLALRDLLQRALDDRQDIGSAGNRGGASLPSSHGAVFLKIPVRIDELLVRLLRSGRIAADAPREKSEEPVRFSGWTLHFAERRLLAPGGGVVRLPGLEFALLRAFLNQPGRVLARAELAEWARRAGRACPTNRSIDTYVCRLRRRFRQAGERAMIVTVRGVGYVFDGGLLHRSASSEG